MEDPAPPERIEFYGPRDPEAGWGAGRAVELVRECEGGRKLRSLNDALELHKAFECEEYGILPATLDQEGQNRHRPASRDSRRQIA